MSEHTVDLLIDAIEATRRAKQELDEALWRLAEIEVDFNRQAKLPEADRAGLVAAWSAAEDELDVAGLIERRQEAQRWAGLVDDCVRVCQRYSFERVIVAQIRRLLAQHAGPEEDLELFAMTLLRHIREPDNAAVYQAAQAVFARLRAHKPLAAEPA